MTLHPCLVFAHFQSFKGTLEFLTTCNTMKQRFYEWVLILLVSCTHRETYMDGKKRKNVPAG